MASLRDLQSAFASAVRGGEAELLESYVVEDGIAPARRLGIYANNVRENFLATLEATFPVIARLAGRDWLRQSGVRYQRACPSRVGNLHYVGERYAAFLEADLAEAPYAYFADVARLEWAYQQVLVAADPAELDRASLAVVPPADYGGLIFELSPAARLVSSIYPLFAIWQSNRAEAPAETGTAIRLDAGPSRVLILRRRDRDHVELRELPAGDFALLSAIARSRPLDAATDEALQSDPALDLAAALNRLVQIGALTGWSLPRPA